MTTATTKTQNLQLRLERRGIFASFEQAETLRRAELTLQKWCELECGDGNSYCSWSIERDETTGKPFKHIYPNKGEMRKYPIADKEKGALKRIAAICKELGIFYFYQSDPRGCALYVNNEPISGNNYTNGIACCD